MEVMRSAGSEDRTVKIWDTRTRDAQREFESRAPVTTVTLVQGQNELISGDQDGNIRVWDITAGACSCELVPEVDVAVRSVSVALDGSQVHPLPSRPAPGARSLCTWRSLIWISCKLPPRLGKGASFSTPKLNSSESLFPGMWRA